MTIVPSVIVKKIGYFAKMRGFYKLADIEYGGVAGVTSLCLGALTRHLSAEGRPEKAVLLTYEQTHAFLLFSGDRPPFAVKGGFTSGYAGEGPRGLSVALMILKRHMVDVEELETAAVVMARMNDGCLRGSDLEKIVSGKPVRPTRLHDYTHEFSGGLGKSAVPLHHYYPNVIPFQLIDIRIFDLAVEFFEDPEGALIQAYRRLETTVQERTGIRAIGGKLFAAAFLADDAPLDWSSAHIAEAKGKGNLFTAVFSAFRNPRVHRARDQGKDALLREFLLVNELFCLEGEARGVREGS